MSCLTLTGVIDGDLPGGNPKALELFANCDVQDLSQYGLGSANNGGSSTLEFEFPAEAGGAAMGDFIYVANSGSNEDFQSFFGFLPDYEDSALSINGDDVVEVFFQGAVVDVLGEIGVDGSGTAWDHFDGWAYRKNGFAPSAVFNIEEWIFSGVNALDDEETNAGAAVPFPLGSFDPDEAPSPSPPPSPPSPPPAPGALGCLLISGTLDGPLVGGRPKMLELYVNCDIDNLGLYAIGSANNGGSSSIEYVFPEGDTWQEGEFIYIENEDDEQAFVEFVQWFGFSPDYGSPALAINGDDAIEVFFNFTGEFLPVDTFGEIGVDGTGEPWEHQDGWAYRKSGTGPDGNAFVLDNWFFSGVNALDGFTSNSQAEIPFPTKSYQSGTFTGLPPSPPNPPPPPPSPPPPSPPPCPSTSDEIRINEVRSNQAGSDQDEYIELIGPPGAPMCGLALIIIGDSGQNEGVLEEVIHLTGFAIPEDGLFLITEDSFDLFDLSMVDFVEPLNLENDDNLTFKLVRGFQSPGEVPFDLDVDDDGLLDFLPYDELIDCISSIGPEGGSTTIDNGDDDIFCDETIGPDGDFHPGHIYRCVEVDGSLGPWKTGDFFGIVDGSEITLDDTPGTPNPSCVPEPSSPPSPPAPPPPPLCSSDLEISDDIRINEIRTNQVSFDTDEYIELIGPPGASLCGLTLLIIGDTGNSNNGVLEEAIELPPTDIIPSDGLYLITESTFDLIPLALVDLVTDLNFENDDNLSFQLVRGYTAPGSIPFDLDEDEDGNLDLVPYEKLIECIALSGPDNDNGIDTIFCDETIGPDGDFHPGHVYRCLDDEMMPGPFIIGEFTGVIDGVGIVGDDTPGSPNLSCSLVAPPGDSGSPPGDCDDVPCGDTNLDGTTNVLDVVETVSVILGSIPPLEGCAFDATDANDDFAIDVLDVVGVVSAILGQDSSPCLQR